MLTAKVIGVGAAGNKAAIHLLKKGVLNPDQVLIINSTLKDVPPEFKDVAIEFGNGKGCGKERDYAKDMILKALQTKQIDLQSWITPEDNLVIIVTSVEGGTGCGASTIIAQYIDQVLEKNVHMFALCGFEDDVRGLKNTVDWFNDLSSKYVVEAISNKKFLTSDNNRQKAQEAANEEFANRIGILLGTEINPSNSNMDDQDLYKVATTPGFMTIETCHLGKIKDQEQFNALIQTMIDDSKSLETDQSAKRMGIVVNTSSKAQGSIDESFEVLLRHYGRPFELFKHHQDTHDDDYINVIVSGLKIPVDEIKAIYEKFKKQMDQVDRSADSFFERKFNTESGDMFNTAAGIKKVSDDVVKKKNNDFFANMGLAPEKEQPKPTKGFQNTVTNEL